MKLGIALILSLSATSLLLFFSPKNPGVSNDSVIYIDGAKSIYKNSSYSTIFPRHFWESPRDDEKFAGNLKKYIEYKERYFISHFPPLYSFLLHFGFYFNIKIETWAKFMNIFIYFLTLFFIILFVDYYLKGKTFYTIISLLLLTIYFVSSKSFSEKFYWVWTEGFFSFLTTIGIILLLLFFEKKKLFFLILSSIIFNLASLTRYAGLSNHMAGFFSILLLCRNKKIMYSLLFLFCSTALVLFFWIMTKFHEQDVRYFGIYITNIKSIEFIIDQIIEKILKSYILFNFPDSTFIRQMFGICLSFTVILSTVYIFLSCCNKSSSQIIQINVCTIFIFILFQTLLQLLTPILAGDYGDMERYFAPFFPVFAMLLFFVILYGFDNIDRSKKITILLLISFVIFLRIFDYINIKDNRNKYGMWWSDFDQRTKSIYKYINAIPDDALIFTNSVSLAYSSMYYFDRVLYPLPYTPDGLENFKQHFSDRSLFIIFGDDYIPLYIKDIKMSITSLNSKGDIIKQLQLKKITYTDYYEVYSNDKFSRQ